MRGRLARWTARHPSIETGAAVVIAGIALGGCVTGPGTRAPGEPGKPVVEFPSPSALSEIQARPAVVPPVDTGEIPGDGWRLEPPAQAPPPATAAPTPAQASIPAPSPDAVPWQPFGPWESAFASDAAGLAKPPRLTRALSCMAHEIGRYYLRTQHSPPELLQRFLLAACDVVVPEAGFFSISGTVPESIDDQKVLDQWRPQLKRDLLAHLPADAPVAGFWYGRQGKHVAAVMAYTTPRATFTTLSLIPDAAGNLIYEGQIAGASDYIEGYANRGRFGVSKCDLDPAVLRPRFRAICHAAPEDATTWIDLVFAPPRRVLAAPFASILARRSASAPPAFERAPYGEANVVSSPGTFATSLHAQLNQVRAAAGLPPVRLSTPQTTAAAALAGHYFAAALAEDSKGGGEERDRIALGLLAGWQLGGTIRDGRFFSGVAGHTRDVGLWLSHAMMTPLGRVTLMASDIEEIAIGPLLLAKPDGLAAVVTGYSLYHGDDHSADINRLYTRLLTARARLSLKLPKRLGGMSDVLARQLAHVRDGSLSPMQALHASLQDGSFRFTAPMRGFVLETTSLEALEIPEEIIRRPNLMLEIGVAHYKPPGAAWGQMIIFVVYVDEGHQLQRI